MSSIEGYRPSAQELHSNLAIMRDTVQKGIAVDRGFLHIFRNSTDHLSGSDRKKILGEIRAVESALDDLSSRVTDVAARSVVDTRPGPVVSAESSLDEMATEYAPQVPLRQNIQALAHDYEVWRIRGDGHCLFRAVGTGVLLNFRYLDGQQKSRAAAHIEREIDKLVGETPEHPLNAARERITQAIRGISPDNDEQTVTSRNRSNQLVADLRLLAVTYNMRHSSETFENHLLVEGLTPSDYQAGMADMREAWEGGEAEIAALAQCLGVSLKVVDAILYKEGSDQHIRVYNREAAMLPVHLLYRPGHYDLLTIS